MCLRVLVSLLTLLHTSELPALIIDDFSVDGGPSTSFVVLNSNSLGGETDFHDPNGIVHFSMSGGILNLDSGGFASNSSILSYDGIDGNPSTLAHLLGAVALTGGTATDGFLIDVAGFSTGSGSTAMLTITVYEDDNRFSASNPVSIGAPGVIAVPFTSLTNSGPSGPADLTSAESIAFQFDIPSETEFSIRQLEAIPEPNAFVLFGLAPVFLLWRRRRAG